MIQKIEEKLFTGLMVIATLTIVLTLLLIIITILYKGVPSLSWEMLTQVPKGGFYFGKEGGILNAIVGSVYLSFGATILALLIGLPMALFMNTYLVKRKKLVNTIRFILDLLWGIPSIVYGAFGFTIMVYLGLRTSLLAGIITVTLFIIPIMIRAMDEVLKNVPKGLMEASLSLGSTKSELAYKIYLKQCIPGLITAMLLSFGRAIGDAASVLFTTGYTDHIPHSLFDPVASLPLAVFFQMGTPFPEVQERAYASALILLVMVLLLTVSSRILTKRFAKYVIK